MSKEATLAGRAKEVIDKTQNAQQNTSSALSSAQHVAHVSLTGFQPTMAEVAAVVIALELLHAVIDALHTAKTNVRDPAGAQRCWVLPGALTAALSNANR